MENIRRHLSSSYRGSAMKHESSTMTSWSPTITPTEVVLFRQTDEVEDAAHELRYKVFKGICLCASIFVYRGITCIHRNFKAVLHPPRSSLIHCSIVGCSEGVPSRGVLNGGGGLWELSPLDQWNLWFLWSFPPPEKNFKPSLEKFLTTPLDSWGLFFTPVFIFSLFIRNFKIVQKNFKNTISISKTCIVCLKNKINSLGQKDLNNDNRKKESQENVRFTTFKPWSE